MEKAARSAEKAAWAVPNDSMPGAKAGVLCGKDSMRSVNVSIPGAKGGVLCGKVSVSVFTTAYTVRKSAFAVKNQLAGSK